MNAKLAEWTTSEEEFISTLSDFSDGNFMYLRQVLRDIHGDRLTPSQLGSIHNLPRGLKAYYRRHWNHMRDMDSEVFDKYYQPIVCMLAQAPAPVTMAKLNEWTKLGIPRIYEVLGRWSEFLNHHIDDRDEIVYYLYHNSFRDFLDEDVGLRHYSESAAMTTWNKIDW